MYFKLVFHKGRQRNNLKRKTIIFILENYVIDCSVKCKLYPIYTGTIIDNLAKIKIYVKLKLLELFRLGYIDKTDKDYVGGVVMRTDGTIPK